MFDEADASNIPLSLILSHGGERGTFKATDYGAVTRTGSDSSPPPW